MQLLLRNQPLQLSLQPQRLLQHLSRRLRRSLYINQWIRRSVDKLTASSSSATSRTSKGSRVSKLLLPWRS